MLMNTDNGCVLLDEEMNIDKGWATNLTGIWWYKIKVNNDLDEYIQYQQEIPLMCWGGGGE